MKRLKNSEERGLIMKKFRNSEKGFTMIELLTVLVILGIVSAIIYKKYASGQARAARIQAEVIDIINLFNAVESYRMARGCVTFNSDNCKTMTIQDLVDRNFIQNKNTAFGDSIQYNDPTVRKDDCIAITFDAPSEEIAADVAAGINNLDNTNIHAKSSSGSQTVTISLWRSDRLSGSGECN